MAEGTDDKVWILLIDDEPTVRDVVTRTLHRYGYNVEAAASGAAGERLLALTPSRFGMAIVDLTLPDLTGEALLARLRVLRPTLPALLISGNPWEGQAEPRTRFLAKPFMLADFVQQVHGLLEAG